MASTNGCCTVAKTFFECRVSASLKVDHNRNTVERFNGSVVQIVSWQ